MRFRLIVLALVGLISAPAAAAAAEADSVQARVRAEIMPSFEAMQAAANVHDAEGHVGFFAQDPNLLFVINGRRIIGWEAVLDQQRKWWPAGRIQPGSRAEIPYKLVAGPEFIVLAPDSALTSFVLDAPKIDESGRRLERTIAISQLWQNRPEGWRVVYAHESVAETPAAE